MRTRGAAASAAGIFDLSAGVVLAARRFATPHSTRLSPSGRFYATAAKAATRKTEPENHVDLQAKTNYGRPAGARRSDGGGDRPRARCCGPTYPAPCRPVSASAPAAY